MESKFINKEQNLPKALDFSFLLKEGITRIQKLAGRNWTDFNEHDPGVTILEQLVYALTDIAYKTSVDFKDLLAAQQQTNLQQANFDISKILPCNPLTIKDYRKIVSDRIEGVRNIWIEPLNNSDKHNFRGLYIALIEIDIYVDIDPEEVRQKTIKLLNDYSNLCEAFEEVIILKKQEIFISAEIEIEKNVQEEKVHATILFTIEQYVSKPIVYNTLNDMLDAGHHVSQIFSGPRLFNGFVPDENLAEKKHVFNKIDVLKKLNNIPGIKAIKSFDILVEREDTDGEESFGLYKDTLTGKYFNDLFVVEIGCVPVLGDKMYRNANNRSFIKYSKDSVAISLNQKKTDKYLRGLKASVKMKYAKKYKYKEEEEDTNETSDDALNLSEYYSVQHHFPKSYGLDKDGLSPKASNKRKAEIFQLKAYLLFFEQVIANYQEQLTRFNELYALDKHVSETYFVQVPWDIPNLYGLIGELTEEMNEEQYREKVLSSVKSMMLEIDDFGKRRNAFINHLLARFGDNSYQFTYDKFNYYYSPEQHRKNIINRKLNILENYDWLSANKARSFNPTEDFWMDKNSKNYANVSVLESRIKIEIGLPKEVRLITSYVPDSVQIDKQEDVKSLKRMFEKYPDFDLQEIPQAFKGIWQKKSKYKNEKDETLLDEIIIDADLFKRGVNQENFKVAKHPSVAKDTYLLLFKLDLEEEVSFSKLLNNSFSNASMWKELLRKAKDQETIEILFQEREQELYCFEFQKDEFGNFPNYPNYVWKNLKEYELEEDAFKTAFSLAHHLNHWNVESEGFYVLDHILLRPRAETFSVDVSITNPNADWDFNFSNHFDYSELAKQLPKEIQRVKKHTITVEEDQDRFRLVCKHKNGEIGACVASYSSNIEALVKAKEVNDFMIRLTDFDISDSKKVKIFTNHLKSKHAYQSYNFTLTIFLSNWTARFSDPEFQQMLIRLFRKHTPAHIALNFQWLNKEQMVKFEKTYASWLDQQNAEKTSYAKLNQLSNQLLEMAKTI
jgi:hypothetical protein